MKVLFAQNITFTAVKMTFYSCGRQKCTFYGSAEVYFKKSFLTLFEHFLFKMKSFVWEFLCISRSIGSWALWNFFQSAETFLIIFEQKLSNLWRNLAILYEKWAYFQCHKEIFLCHSCSRASWGLCKWKCSSFMLQLLWELYWEQLNKLSCWMQQQAAGSNTRVFDSSIEL